MEKKAKRNRVLLAILLALFCIAGIFTCLTQVQEKAIASLESSIAKLKESSVLVKFTILSRSSGMIFFSMVLLDADGKPVNATSPRIEYPSSIRGKELFFDFRVFQLKDGGGRLLFPIRVYSDEVPADSGISLIPYYDEAGLPIIYRSSDMDDESFKELFVRSEIFKRVKANDFSESEYGTFVHDIKGTAEYQLGIPYKIVGHTKGGAEAMRFEEDLK